MKKHLFFFLFLLLISSCGKKDTTAEKTAEAGNSLDTDTIFSFTVDKLPSSCDNSSEIVCTINLAVKCLLNPQFSECSKAKDLLPSFLFMVDETLQLPTFHS